MIRRLGDLNQRILSMAGLAKAEAEAALVQESGAALPDLDVGFYRDYYADLRHMTPEEASMHWIEFGRAEGRHGTPASMLAEVGRKGKTRLPKDFDWRAYLGLNPQVGLSAGATPWKLELHYLQHGKRSGLEYQFDPDFYRGLYPDLRTIEGYEGLLDHYLQHGREEGRFRHPSQFWKHLGIQGEPLECLISPDEFRRANVAHGGDEFANKWRILNLILGGDSPRFIPVGSHESTGHFYHALGDAYALAGKEQIAQQCYLTAFSSLPDDGRITQALGDSCLRQRRYEDAVQCYRRAMQNGQAESFWTHQNCSTALEALGQHDEALDQAIAARFADKGLQAGIRSLDGLLLRRWNSFDRRAQAALLMDDRDAAHSLYEEAAGALDAAYPDPLAPGRIREGLPRVALVVDPFLPQCVRYRVAQKVQQFEKLGQTVEVIPWPEVSDKSFAALSMVDIVIFYRVPALHNVVRAMKHCRAAGKVVVYEIDDLVFDYGIYPDAIESYGGLVTPDEYRNLVRGSVLFRIAIQEADYALVSTQPLAEHISPLVRRKKAYIHRNGLDDVNEPYLQLPPRPATDGADGLTLFYGTGTKAHNADFDDLLAPALARILSEFPGVRFMVVGYLTLPDVLKPYASQIATLGFVQDVAAYTQILRGSDINLAVLHRNAINDAKSELKWFEAAVFGIPSVVSNTRNYLDVTRDEVDVLHAGSADEWYAQVRRLIVDPELRARIGAAARETVSDRYALEPQSRNLQSILEDIAAGERALANGKEAGPSSARKKLLIVNVFFPPQSIGGATRVVSDNVELLLERYAEKYDIEVLTSDHENPTPYVVDQYAWKGVRVTKISTPQKAGMDWDFKDEEMAKIFDSYLEYSRPDLVHFHCIQRLTASVVNATRKRAIPYVVTAHDAWWISDHQFLVDEEGEVCDVRQADVAVQARQSKNLAKTMERLYYLRQCLEGAAAILPVSETFSEIYRINRFQRVRTVRNGVMPLDWRSRSASPTGRVRVAHIGGMSNHKGYHLFVEALENRHFGNIEALVVDLSKPHGYRNKGYFGTTPVTFIGRVPHEKIADLYAHMDVLVAPSIWPESFGLVTREAVAAGCWVIASGVGAIGEDVEVGVNGFIVDVTDASALESMFADINSEPSRYLSRNGNDRVRQVSDQVSELVAVYDEVLDGERNQ